MEVYLKIMWVLGYPVNITILCYGGFNDFKEDNKDEPYTALPGLLILIAIPAITAAIILNLTLWVT
jgi:hypothetical protein